MTNASLNIRLDKETKDKANELFNKYDYCCSYVFKNSN